MHLVLLFYCSFINNNAKSIINSTVSFIPEFCFSDDMIYFLQPKDVPHRRAPRKRSSDKVQQVIEQEELEAACHARSAIEVRIVCVKR